MQVRFPHSAGLDVHKASVVANIITGHDEKGNEIYDGKRFGTITQRVPARPAATCRLAASTRCDPCRY